MLVVGAMPTADQALAIGLVDEVVDLDQVQPRAIAWLSELLALPSSPMLATRALARADIVAALTDPKRVDLDRFMDAWNHPDTQGALQALVARLRK
jgi:enoyl-CoA hydratase/carnithine racemase